MCIDLKSDVNRILIKPKHDESEFIHFLMCSTIGSDVTFSLQLNITVTSMLTVSSLALLACGTLFKDLSELT